MYILGALLPVGSTLAGILLIATGFADGHDGLAIAGAILIGSVLISSSFPEENLPKVR